MDPYALLGVQPGASKAEIKKAFFGKAKQHHPDMHTTAPESVKKANDAAFRVLNEAYQALMDGSHRQRSSAGFSGRSGFGRGPGGGYYGSAAASAAGRGAGQYYDPFQTYYGAGTGTRYSGWQQYRRRGGLDFRGTFRAFTNIGRVEAAATATLGLLLAGGVLLLEDASQSLWARNNEGKLFDSIQRDYEHKKQQKERAAEEAATALRAATAAMRAQAAGAAAQPQQQQQTPAAQQQPQLKQLKQLAAATEALQQQQQQLQQQQQQAAAAVAVTTNSSTGGSLEPSSSSAGKGSAGQRVPALIVSPAETALENGGIAGKSSSVGASEAATGLAPAPPVMLDPAASDVPAA